MAMDDFSKGNTKATSKTTGKPLAEHKLFATKTMAIVIPTFEAFGFKKHRVEIGNHASTLIYRKGDQYLKISSNTYPREYPYHFNILLGEGNSEDFFEYDWNAVPLWRFKKVIKPELKAGEFEFPTADGIEKSLKNAKAELLKYGQAFLNGDLDLFYQIRKAQNIDRAPYKIHSPDKNGNYQTIVEPKSLGQKKKYS